MADIHPIINTLDGRLGKDGDGAEELSELEDEMALRSALLRSIG